MESNDPTRSLTTDDAPFSVWLRAQVHRRDRVGAVARTALQADDWPAGTSRAAMASYFRNKGARPFVMQSVAQAWDEFERSVIVRSRRTKNKAARQARRNNRR